MPFPYFLVGLIILAGSGIAQAEEGMILIPAGSFKMGLSPEQQQQLAREYHLNPDLFQLSTNRTVEVKSFYIDQYEVTNGQFRKFIEKTNHPLPIPWLDRGMPSREMDSCPVVGVDYEDAVAYAKWAGKRLPREEEWEYAARGTDGRLWVWGNDWRKEACRMDNSSGGPLNMTPSPAGSFPQDKSIFGVYDMAGNVLEWVQTERPQNLDYTAITKGGGLINAAPFMFACAYRNAQPKGNGRVSYIGFRCAKDALTGAKDAAVPAAPPTDPLSPTRGQTLKSSTKRIPFPKVSSPKMPVQIFPVFEKKKDLVYLPVSEESKKEGTMTPWRLELRAPSLPEDRFAILMENHTSRLLKESNFNKNHTRAELISVNPNELDIKIIAEGHEDYVDLHYHLKNNGKEPIMFGHEMCFQTLWAPNFRDHDGHRTFISTDQGLRPLLSVNHQVWERALCQDFWLNRPSYPGTGPTVQGDAIMVNSRDGQWTVAPGLLSEKAIRLFNNREYSCMHCNPESSMGPGKEKRILQRLYFFHGSPKELVKRYRQDRENY